MTTVLPALALCPLSSHFGYGRAHTERQLEYPNSGTNPVTVFTRLLHNRHQDVSQHSAHSAPVIQNDENNTLDPHVLYRHLLQSAPAFSPNEPIHQISSEKPDKTAAPAITRPHQFEPTRQHLSKNWPTVTSIKTTRLHGFQNDTPTLAKEQGLAANGKTTQFRAAVHTSNSSEESLEPFPPFCTTPLPSNGDQPDENATSQTSLRQASDLSWNEGAAPQFSSSSHRQRPSNATSRFVHSIKTASMSNDSLSIFPHSLKMTLSISSSDHLREHSRLSLDSCRPQWDFPDDDIAFMRSLKRRQIINELIMTEESYVVDLKALVYLYSTLLASATTVSAALKAAIQRNVTSLLHVHEKLLSQLRQANLRAAARKWADTKFPTRLNRSNAGQGRVAAKSLLKSPRLYRMRARSSGDGADVSRSYDIHSTADPVDASEIATVMNRILEDLFVYEEYCANHEIIAGELHKHMPSLWSTYESGMESLNRALVALDQQEHQGRKGVTVSDLLIKPIQRICKYPLLLKDLMKQTPVVDSPGAYETLESTLGQVQTIVQTINVATGSSLVREQIQRKWLLRDRIQFAGNEFSNDKFRMLGNVQLCGVLYFTCQKSDSKVEGAFAVCLLFDNHFAIAISSPLSTKFELCMVVALPDLRIESADRGKGLQAPAALHTWKLCFTAEENLHEILLSACSKAEEDQWTNGLRGFYRPDHYLHVHTTSDQSKTLMDLKSLGSVFRPNIPLSRQTSVQRAATVASRTGTCQVILRNTNNPQDLHEYRNASLPIIGRSQSHGTANKIVILAPKRSDRTRLETSLSDLYTKDRLPFPGMIASKSGQIIRASAGSLARKLSFASMHASFSRRTASLSSKRSCDTTRTLTNDPPTFTILKRSLDDHNRNRKAQLKELPEIDTMNSLIERMINGGNASTQQASHAAGGNYVHGTAKSFGSRRSSTCEVGPEDPASIFYDDGNQNEVTEKEWNCQPGGKQDGILGNSRKKRWSNPMAMLRDLGGMGIRHILTSSK